MSTVDVAGGTSAVPSGTWSVDPSRSRVAFSMKHMMLATLRGSFGEFDGSLQAGPGAPRAGGVVKAASIDTKEPVRDEHLRSSTDFFDVERIELELRGELNRRDFGLNWNQTLDTSGALLGNKVKIALDISAVKRPAGGD